MVKSATAAARAPAPELKCTQFELSQIDETGTFEGYASLFDREDLGRDIVVAGAFAESLGKRGATGIKLLFQHDANEPIGIWDVIREDARGLFARAPHAPCAAAWKGITPTALNTAGLKRELRAIPDDVVRAIYLKKYWEPALCGELAAPLALMHFDAAVNHGVGAAIRMLQGPRLAQSRRAHARCRPHPFSKPDTQSPSIETGESPMAKDLAKDMTAAAEPKWWGQSLTIWGVVITALSSVVPALAPVIGVDIPADMVQDAGGQVVSTVQAITGLAGTLLAIFGRIRAKQPLARREMSIRL